MELNWTIIATITVPIVAALTALAVKNPIGYRRFAWLLRGIFTISFFVALGWDYGVVLTANSLSPYIEPSKIPEAVARVQGFKILSAAAIFGSLGAAAYNEFLVWILPILLSGTAEQA